MTTPLYRHRFNNERQAMTELARALGDHDAALARANEEYAAKWNAEKRRQAEKNGDALPGGKFPIVDQEDMNNAAQLSGNSSVPRATVIAHMRKQARKHGLKLPASLAATS